MFIWKKEIEAIEEREWASLETLLEVVFKDWTKWNYTKKQLEYICTENEFSDSEVQNTSANEIVKDILNILEQHNMRNWDMQFIIQKLLLSYNTTLDTLIAQVFTWADEYHNIKMSDIEAVKKRFI